MDSKKILFSALLTAFCFSVNADKTPNYIEHDKGKYKPFFQFLKRLLIENLNAPKSETASTVSDNAKDSTNPGRLANLIAINPSLASSSKIELLMDLCKETGLSLNVTLSTPFNLFNTDSTLTIFQFIVHQALFIAHQTGNCTLELIKECMDMGAHPFITAVQGKFSAFNLAKQFNIHGNEACAACAQNIINLFQEFKHTADESDKQ